MVEKGTWQVDPDPERERLRRWRLVLGKPAAKSLAGRASSGRGGSDLGPQAAPLDRCLEQLYDGPGPRVGPHLSRWLGDIRRYFPRSVVQVLERDAVERCGLEALLDAPQVLEQLEPDVHLAATLVRLAGLIPRRTRDTARRVVQRVVEQLLRKLQRPTRAALRGSLDRARRQQRPRGGDIDWPRTVLKNLKNYAPQHGGLVLEKLVGRGRRRASLHDVFLCVDQSGSMAASLVYAALFAAVLAALPSLTTRIAVFDTEVVELSALARDPVELLFSTQLGGGTDIAQALAWCQARIHRPARSLLVLLSDLEEGGAPDALLQRAAALVRAGVRLVALLALSDEGAPRFDGRVARSLAGLGVPCFACTPALFPGLMAAAIRGADLHSWAARHEIALVRADQEPST